MTQEEIDAERALVLAEAERSRVYRRNAHRKRELLREIHQLDEDKKIAREEVRRLKTNARKLKELRINRKMGERKSRQEKVSATKEKSRTRRVLRHAQKKYRESLSIDTMMDAEYYLWKQLSTEQQAIKLAEMDIEMTRNGR
jgi:hypothetical protein